MSRRLGEQGEVRLSIHVGSDGRVITARVAQSSGWERLDKAAIEAVSVWRFIPAQKDGVAVEDWYHDWIWTFRLDQ
jgi:protein TonB